jgi:hypothetical protein
VNHHGLGHLAGIVNAGDGGAGNSNTTHIYFFS